MHSRKDEDPEERMEAEKMLGATDYLGNYKVYTHWGGIQGSKFGENDHKSIVREYKHVCKNRERRIPEEIISVRSPNSVLILTTKTDPFIIKTIEEGMKYKHQAFYLYKRDGSIVVKGPFSFEDLENLNIIDEVIMTFPDQEIPLYVYYFTCV